MNRRSSLEMTVSCHSEVCLMLSLGALFPESHGILGALNGRVSLSHVDLK